MEEKPQSVFEKLDSQSEQIEDISKKLEGVSVEDLYALAKRTWDYGDFQTAQKYYNHISLLRPLDWEAPLYASLCNFKGMHNMSFWVVAPQQEEPIIVATINYINNLSIDNDKKETEMNKCINILIPYLTANKKHYFKYQKEYTEAKRDYVFDLQNMFLDIYEKINAINLKSIRSFQTALADMCLEIIKTVNKISPKMNEQLFEQLTNSSSKDWGVAFKHPYERVTNVREYSSEEVKDLPLEEKNKILLSATVYKEFDDKIIGKRISVRRLLIGAIFAILSIAGFVVSLLSLPVCSFVFIVSFLLSVWILFLSFNEKERINCSSLFSSARIKIRLTSNNTITVDGKICLFKLLYIISFLISGGASILFSISLFSSKNDIDIAIKIVFTVCIVTSTVLQYFGMLIGSSSSHFDSHFIFKTKNKDIK